MSSDVSRIFVPADVDGEIIVCPEGLSFWGGVDPETGRVIDTHHDLCGQSLSGKIVLMPTSRGSCSGSGVLLELALNERAPAAFVFREVEEILTLGAEIAARMFGRTVGVLRLPAVQYDALSSRRTATIRGNRLLSDSLSIDLSSAAESDLDMTPSDKAMLEGDRGEAVRLAMEVICATALSQGATRLVDVSRGHIDGCIYAHAANLIFAERMVELGAAVGIPTTINAISVDRENWMEHGLPPEFGRAASRLADAYVRMGARPTFTCAPYLADDIPRAGEDIAWSESNAVIFANSALGARTAKHPDYLDLFIAMTGRAPETGVYLPENRRAGIVLEVDCPVGHDDALWPLLGWVAGSMSPDRVPLLTGLEVAAPNRDDLRALCAAFGTTSAAPMLHVAGGDARGGFGARGRGRARAPHQGASSRGLGSVQYRAG